MAKQRCQSVPESMVQTIQQLPVLRNMRESNFKNTNRFCKALCNNIGMKLTDILRYFQMQEGNYKEPQTNLFNFWLPTLLSITLQAHTLEISHLTLAWPTLLPGDKATATHLQDKAGPPGRSIVTDTAKL